MRFKDKKILVIEDEDDIRELIVDTLESQGARVVQASDGAVGLWKIQSEQFDIIITDVMMPNLNGIALVKKVRSIDLNRGTPIFIVSGALDDGAIAKVSKLGIVSVIKKPFKSSDLVDLVSGKLESGPKDQPFYDKAAIKCFLAGVRDVMEFYFDEKPAIGKPVVKDERQACGLVSGLISFVSERSRGSMAMTLNRKFLNLLSDTLFGDNADNDDLTSLNNDIAGELCNQVLGRVKANFAQIGVRIKVGLPDVIIGENHSIIHKVKSQCLSIPVTVGDAQCVIECCMEKVDSSAIDREAS